MWGGGGELEVMTRKKDKVKSSKSKISRIGQEGRGKRSYM